MPLKSGVEKLLYVEREEPAYVQVASVPEEYLRLLLPYAGVYFERDEQCDMLSQHIQLSPFSFWIQETFTNEDIILCPYTPRPIWALHFMYRSSVRVELYQDVSFSLEEEECNLFNLVSDLHKVPMEAEQEMSSCHINILPEDIRELAKQYPALRRLANKKPANITAPINKQPYYINAACDFLVQKMLTCRHVEVPAHHFLYRCCIELFTNFAYQDAHAKQRPFISDIFNEPSFRQLFTYLTDNPHINHSVSQLAEKFQLSEDVLQKGFQMHFGMSLKKFIKMITMMRAFELLTEKSTPLSAIAHTAGYKSWQNLNQAFLRYYSCEMEELRRAM
ncbi:AraC-type DNA-binding protein [Chitinophaga sp. YR573]|uniref:helix-turn-helix domain-containing protein n=1 Tax=Chitinophaga sp. YR573 TaxID=1881040 RepID=UPI0008AFA6CC|nr:AraC family transcriptional regulator [Chitinophaga sp. YR573]SEW04077.1 AraC-type DNA-binding protein [Chitinophaga sp. YR573]